MQYAFGAKQKKNNYCSAQWALWDQRDTGLQTWAHFVKNDPHNKAICKHHGPKGPKGTMQKNTNGPKYGPIHKPHYNAV